MDRKVDQAQVSKNSAVDFHNYQQCYERPMMLNAWTQTCCEDLKNVVVNSFQRKLQDSVEKELLETIRKLELKLQAHSELMCQQYAHISEHTVNTDSTMTPQLDEHPQKQYANLMQTTTQKTNSPNLSLSVLNPLQQASLSATMAGSVNYTIIAQGHEEGSVDPIEIRLTEDEEEMHLKSPSPDPGRLEISVSNETDPKNDSAISESHMLPPMETILSKPIKRRKPTFKVPPAQEEHYQHEGSIAQCNVYTANAVMQKDSENVMAKNWENKMVADFSNVSKPMNGIAKAETHIPPKDSNLAKPSKRRKLAPKVPSEQVFCAQEDDQHKDSIGEGKVKYASHKMDTDNVMVSIGPNNTRVAVRTWDAITWASASIATRKLLMTLFDRHTLATHSMTGKPSPAFKDLGKPLKQMLNPLIIHDIIFAVTRKCKVSEKEVRNAITTKCADENKMMKQQLIKYRFLHGDDKENAA